MPESAPPNLSENEKGTSPRSSNISRVENDASETSKIADEPVAKRPKRKKKTSKKTKRKKFGYNCCNKYSCKGFCKQVCPHFPGCCALPLQNCLQLLALLDLMITLINIGIWIYFHQYDPFTHNIEKMDNSTEHGAAPAAPAPPVDNSKKLTIDISEFHESTTAIYGENGQQSVIQGDGVVNSKIGFVYRQYQQEVENTCGRNYYTDFLVGHRLTVTNGVFSDLLTMTYTSEFIYQFIDISILATTCCFFDYASGRLYLIIIWNLELVPILLKLYLIVESRSQRLCILQYGLGKSFRGIDALIYLHFLPLILFRAYKLLVFTYFVGSMLELGNLEHQTRIQGVTLHEYADRHEEYLRMDKNREKSSSDDDDIDNV